MAVTYPGDRWYFGLTPTAVAEVLQELDQLQP